MPRKITNRPGPRETRDPAAEMVVEQMAVSLADAARHDALDLGDERACIAALRYDRYGAGAVEAFLETAIERARALAARASERAS